MDTLRHHRSPNIMFEFVSCSQHLRKHSIFISSPTQSDRTEWLIFSTVCLLYLRGYEGKISPSFSSQLPRGSRLPSQKFVSGTNGSARLNMVQAPMTGVIWPILQLQHFPLSKARPVRRCLSIVIVAELMVGWWSYFIWPYKVYLQILNRKETKVNKAIEIHLFYHLFHSSLSARAVKHSLIFFHINKHMYYMLYVQCVNLKNPTLYKNSL